MSDDINNYNYCKNAVNGLKNNWFFFVFNDLCGYNILLITKDDQVHAFGIIVMDYWD